MVDLQEKSIELWRDAYFKLHSKLRKGSGVCLAELREMLMPGLQKMVDDMYTEHPGQWKSVFLEK